MAKGRSFLCGKKGSWTLPTPLQASRPPFLGDFPLIPAAGVSPASATLPPTRAHTSPSPRRSTGRNSKRGGVQGQEPGEQGHLAREVVLLLHLARQASNPAPRGTPHCPNAAEPQARPHPAKPIGDATDRTGGLLLPTPGFRSEILAQTRCREGQKTRFRHTEELCLPHSPAVCGGNCNMQITFTDQDLRKDRESEGSTRLLQSSRWKCVLWLST